MIHDEYGIDLPKLTKITAGEWSFSETTSLTLSSIYF